MTDDKDEDLKIVILPEVQARMDAAMADDPELKASVSDMFAAFHQAMDGVKTGRYANFEDAMEAITGQRPERVELDDDGETLE